MIEDENRNDESENLKEPEEYQPVTVESLIRILSILFVLGLYGVIFLKILILK